MEALRSIAPAADYAWLGASDPRDSGPTLWPPGPELRLRNTIDALANALQSATLLSGRLRHQLKSHGRDGAALDEAIGRAVSGLRQLQPETRDG